jgi:hypothetical protein
VTRSLEYRPVDPGALVEQLISAVLESDQSWPVRLAVDRPDFVDDALLVPALESGLRAAGRPAAIVDTRGFWRDASLRLEYGRDDVQSFYEGWLDVAALRREVLGPLGGGGFFLPSLRDPHTNRTTRAAPRLLPPGGVAIVTGALLLGRGLDFDVTVHLVVSGAARRRLASPEVAWTLPAYDRYEREVDPASIADVAVRYDDPRHPAVLRR